MKKAMVIGACQIRFIPPIVLNPTILISDHRKRKEMQWKRGKEEYVKIH